MRTLVGKRKYLRANCAQIAKFANFAKNCAPKGRKFAQKLRAKAKFAKNCDFARKGEICAKIAPARLRFLQGLVKILLLMCATFPEIYE